MFYNCTLNLNNSYLNPFLVGVSRLVVTGNCFIHSTAFLSPRLPLAIITAMISSQLQGMKATSPELPASLGDAPSVNGHYDWTIVN